MSTVRRVLVTGAASGIGAAVTRHLALEGDAIACLDRDAAALRSFCESLSPAPLALVADISDPLQLADARKMLLGSLGGLDILVNNAGVNIVGSIAEVSESAWRTCLDVNLTGAFLLTKAFWPDFVAQGHGIVINISSIMGLAGDHASIAYCTAKAGVIAMTQCLAIDGAVHGIRVNCVSPGYVDTPPTRAVLTDPANAGLLQEIERQLPIGRMATPAEIASVIGFLASNGSSYLNGANLVVDGGATLGYRGSTSPVRR